MDNVKCIIGVVERGKADLVVNGAKAAGATGATIFFARGTGETEAKRFFNITVESSKEIIIILSEESKRKEIMKAMTKAGDLKEAGTGIIFSFDVESLVGFNHRNLPEEFEI